MTKFLLKKREERGEHFVQVVETTHTEEELLELLENDYEDLVCEWTHSWDEGRSVTYEVEPLKEGTYEEVEVYELGTVEGFFDEPEAPLGGESKELLARPDTAKAKRAFVEALSGVLKQVREPYTEQGELAERFWEAGFRYADELLGKWEKVQYPDGAEDTETTTLAGALKDLWESLGTLHSIDTGEGETGERVFVDCLEEVKELLNELDPD